MPNPTAVPTPQENSGQKILTRAQVRQFDRIAIERFGIPSIVLMENAARGATDQLCQASSHDERSAAIICGKGNNGGDGMVMARHLLLRGWKTKVVLLTNPENLSQDSGTNYRILSQVRKLTHSTAELVEGRSFSCEQLKRQLDGYSWLVDAMVGTGASPPLRSPFCDVVSTMNELEARKLAIDVPSGLDCDTDLVDGEAFNACLTTSFVALKPVMATDTGKRYCGEIRIVDIGAPAEIFDLIDGSDF